MRTSRWMAAGGLLAVAVLGGCASHSGPATRAPSAAPASVATTTAPLFAAADVHETYSATEGRFIDAGLIIETFVDKFAKTDAEQIAPEVIDNGVFRFVPYLSYASSKFELNIYGDPRHPAGVEIGARNPDARTQEEIRRVMARLLPQAADREVVLGLALARDKRERNDLTFEVTPSTDDDASGRWWVSIYGEKAVEAARATDAEIKAIAQAAPAPASPAAQAPKKTARKAKQPSAGNLVYVKNYGKKDGAYCVNPGP